MLLKPLCALIILAFGNVAIAGNLDNVDKVESADQLVNEGGPDDLDRIYRGGDVVAGELDPWAVPNPNTDDSQLLEDQMNPSPTIEYDQQLYGE